MRTRSRLAPTLAAAVLAFWVATAASAEALNRSYVAPDARWFVHLDMDKLMATPLGQTIRDTWMADAQNAGKLAELRMITGMNPWRDLRSLTLYGPSGDGAEAVAVVRADADPATLENALELARDHNTLSHGRHTVHIWTPDGGEHDTMALVVVDPKTYVVGVSPERVRAAVDAIDAPAPAPGKEPGGVGLFGDDAPADVWLQMVVRDVHTLPRLQNRNPWLDALQNLRATVATAGDDVAMTIAADMSGPAAATQVRQMLEGLKAMAVFRSSRDNPAATPHLEQIAVQAEDRRVWIDWSVPSSKLIQMIQEHGRRERGAREAASPQAEPGVHRPSLDRAVGDLLQL